MKKMLQALNCLNLTLCVSASLRDELFRLRLIKNYKKKVDKYF